MRTRNNGHTVRKATNGMFRKMITDSKIDRRYTDSWCRATTSNTSNIFYWI